MDVRTQNSSSTPFPIETSFNNNQEAADTFHNTGDVVKKNGNMPNKLLGKKEFLKVRREQEKAHFLKNTKKNLIDSLLTVELNITELCNRKCSFCPRFDSNVYPNRNLHMSIFGAEIISKKLSDVGYSGKISFSGFSECFLNPNFSKIVNVFNKNLPQSFIETNTNGDQLNEKIIRSVFDSGLNSLYINLYDGVEQMESFEAIIPEQYKDKIKYRMHWDGEDHGLYLNNRSGKITWTGLDGFEITALRGKPCYYPFYKMFVDWNGDVLFCSNDWGNERVVGNLIQNSLEEVWFSKAMTKIRKKLAQGDRSASPCNKCNVGGALFGEKSFKVINEHYKNSINR